jgi:phenylalanyl-tRNA synthetase alpha chain
MSGPNTEYDPVEVTPLREDEVLRMRDEALAAIAAAPDLAALKQVRTDHLGDRSPLALANREIGALPPQARKEAGQRVGRPAVPSARPSPSGRTVLEAEHEERMLVEETVDVTLPWDRRTQGAGTRSRCPSGSPTSSWPWAGRSPRARSSRPSG